MRPAAGPTVRASGAQPGRAWGRPRSRRWRRRAGQLSARSRPPNHRQRRADRPRWAKSARRSSGSARSPCRSCSSASPMPHRARCAGPGRRWAGGCRLAGPRYAPPSWPSLTRRAGVRGRAAARLVPVLAEIHRGPGETGPAQVSCCLPGAGCGGPWSSGPRPWPGRWRWPATSRTRRRRSRARPGWPTRPCGRRRAAACPAGSGPRPNWRRDRFGGLLGVGSGSARPPRLIELSYQPADSRQHVVLVGKGITFDSGGLSLKPTDNMKLMKTDMAGGAAVIAAMSALAALGVTGPGNRPGGRGGEHAVRFGAAGRGRDHALRRADASRCSTPTRRAGWCWPTRWPMRTRA